MYYLDTAVVLTLFVGESTSATVQDWLARRSKKLACSDWGLTECASALGIKCRRGELDAEAAARTFAAINAFTRESCVRIACAAHHQVAAQTLLGRFELNLRAGDALHLAICRDAGTTLVTYDRLLLAGAASLDIEARNPLSD